MSSTRLGSTTNSIPKRTADVSSESSMRSLTTLRDPLSKTSTTSSKSVSRSQGPSSTSGMISKLSSSTRNKQQGGAEQTMVSSTPTTTATENTRQRKESKRQKPVEAGRKLEIRTSKLTEIPFKQLLEGDTPVSHLAVCYTNVASMAIPPEFRYDEDLLKALKRITRLSIICCLLQSTEGIQHFSHLQELSIPSNSITNLSGLNELKELKGVNMDSNQLVSLGDAFVNCRRLEYIHVSHNQLEDFGSGFNASSNTLKEIHAADNKISSLKGFGRGLQCVDELNLSRNPLKSIGDIASSLRSSLKVLHLDQCQITSTSNWKPFPNLTHLYLSNNNVSSLENFPTLFPSLEVLNIRNNRLISVSSIEPLKTIAESLLVVKVTGNPLCSQPDFVEEIKKVLPHIILDDQEYKPPPVILKEEEKKLFEDSAFDFRMDLDTLKKQLDLKLQQEKDSHLVQPPEVDPATEKFLKMLDAKDESQKQQSKDKIIGSLISKDDARLMYEECQKAQDLVEQKFSEVYDFLDTPYEDFILDGKKIIKKTITIAPEEIRNVSRPGTASLSRPSSVMSSLTSASFEEYFRPGGVKDLDLSLDDFDDESMASARSGASKTSKLKKRYIDAQLLSSQITEELGDGDSSLSHHRMYKTSGLDRKSAKTSEEILKTLNIPTVAQSKPPSKAASTTAGPRKFRVPKRLLEKVNNEKSNTENS